MSDAPSSPAPADEIPGGSWPAPTPGEPVHARVSVPGSKSLTNRELVLAAIAETRT